MSYAKKTWKDYPDTSTLVTASDLNRMEQGIDDATTGLDNKQDSLSTQTAYTSKGSATKVAQITTNTLGQVTDITEVDIDASNVEANPSGTASEQLLTIGIDDTIYSLPNGGGSSVDIVTAWETTTSNVKVPSEKLVKDTFDGLPSTYAPTDAEKNIIVGVQKNGTDLTPDSNRKVNIVVPTKASDVGALPDTTTIPTKASDIGALPDTTTIPSKLSDLTDDSTHRVVTDTEKTSWSGKQAALTTVQQNAVNSGITKTIVDAIPNSYAPTDAEKNIIVGVQKNGSDLTPDSNRKVNISVPTVTDTYSATSSNAMSGKAVASAISGKADKDLVKGIAGTNDVYDAGIIYGVDDYTIHNNKMYQCIKSIFPMPEPPDATYWKEVSVADLNSNLNAVGKCEKLLDRVNTGTHTVSNLSQYRFIYIGSSYTTQNIMYGSNLTPYEIFKLGYNHIVNGTATSNVYNSNNNSMIQYLSDTQIKVTTYDSNIRIIIYGIK